jgi:hypothetical protein
MTRARNQRLSVFRALGSIGLGAVWAVACGGPQKQVDGGAVCFRSDDCKVGFACVPETMGSSKRVCSADLSSIVFMVDGAPPEAAAPASDAATGGSDGGVPPAAGGSDAAGAPDLPTAGSSGVGTAGSPNGGGGG